MIMTNIIPAHQQPRLVRLYLYCGALAILAQNVAALASTAPLSLCQELGLNVEQLHRNIAVAGQVHLHHNFLNEKEIQVLLDDIKDLETKSGKFVPSGLSNTVKGSKQEFGQRDRMTASVPWWRDSIDNERLLTTEAAKVAQKLHALRAVLAQVLDRPTLLNAELEHECYYSKSTSGSTLARHMDERHEDLKGAKGWLLPSRRSISWLIYLSDEGWDLDRNGGALRTFHQPNKGPGGSQHDGNLQVGWLQATDTMTHPVYLDSWFPVNDDQDEPHCILYTITTENERNYLTRPWVNEGLLGMAVTDFLQARVKADADSSKPSNDLRLFISSTIASQFFLLEDRSAWEAGSDPEGAVATNIAPLRGLLVMFDSVSVPHQVEVVKQGTRIALAGWFHEVTQPFPGGM